MNSRYGGLHISVKNKRNKEASDEVYIQDKNMSASGKAIQLLEMLQQKFSSRHRELDNISWFDFANDY